MAREIFVAPALGGFKAGCDAHTEVIAEAIMASKLLQYGMTLPWLIASLRAGNSETGPSDPPLILAALQAAWELETSVDAKPVQMRDAAE